MNDVTFSIDQIRRVAVELIADRSGPLDATWAAYAKAAAELCLALSALAGGGGGRPVKLYQNGDRCPCCGTVLEGKTGKWLAEFSQLVDDLGLPPWPGLAESWDADALNEQAPKREETTE